MPDMNWLEKAEYRLEVLENLGLDARERGGPLLKDQLLADGRKLIAAVRLAERGFTDIEGARADDPMRSWAHVYGTRLRSGEFGEDK